MVQTEAKVKQVGDDLKKAKNAHNDAQRKKVDLACVLLFPPFFSLGR